MPAAEAARWFRTLVQRKLDAAADGNRFGNFQTLRHRYFEMFEGDDSRHMQRALELAIHARDAEGEVPVGAVLVLDGQVVGEGWNRNISLNDPSAHAEISALRDAGQRLGNHRFPGTTLYVTLEPCAMCAMALVHARVARVVYGASDPRAGAAGSVFDTLISDRHNHQVRVEGGLMSETASALLKEFFRARR